MSQSEQRGHKKIQNYEIDPFDVELHFKMDRYEKQRDEISDFIQSKQSTSNQFKKSSSDYQILTRISQDESQISNVYDLEQLSIFKHKTDYRLFMNKEYDRSFKLQQRLMKMVQRNPEYYHQQALTYLALNDIDNAQKCYEGAILMSPCYDRYFFDYEIVDYLPEIFRDQIKHIQNNIDYYKECENQLIAECFFAYHVYVCQRPQKSLKMMMMLIERYPKSYLPYFYASKCYHHIGNYYKGLEFINNAIMCFRYKDIQLYNLKGNKYIIQTKGRILIQSGDLEDAMRVYQLFPNNKYFNEQLDFLNSKIDSDKRKQEQQKKAQKVIIKQPGKVEYEFQEKGINYYKQRKYEESRECLLIALEQNPNNGLCLFMITKCCLKLGDFDSAQDHSNIASSIYEDEDRLVKLLHKIKNEKNRLHKKTYKGYQSRIIL